MADQSKGHGKEPSPADLAALKQRLKSGKVTTEDVKCLEELVEKTEQSAKNLRAAIVE
jgi:hypothetical protein